MISAVAKVRFVVMISVAACLAAGYLASAKLGPCCLCSSDGVLVARELRLVDEGGRVRIKGQADDDGSRFIIYRPNGQEGIVLSVREGDHGYGRRGFSAVALPDEPRIAFEVDSEGGVADGFLPAVRAELSRLCMLVYSAMDPCGCIERTWMVRSLWSAFHP